MGQREKENGSSFRLGVVMKWQGGVWIGVDMMWCRCKVDESGWDG